MSRKIVMFVGETASGDFIDPITGARLPCVMDDGCQKLVDRFTSMRSGDGVLKMKKDEIKLKSIHLMASGTAGGCLKAPHKFK